MTKTALIIGSDGSEDMELIITSDVLRRGEIDVTIAGLQDRPVIELARKARLTVDKPFKDIVNNEYDLVVVPGGPGYEKIAQCTRAGELLKRHEKAGKLVAAICAGPDVFRSHGIGKGATLTSYPTVKDKLVEAGYTYSEDKVVVCNNLITSRGPGTAFEFALQLVELLSGKEKAHSVRSALLLS
jgi:protein DJ-1